MEFPTHRVESGRGKIIFLAWLLSVQGGITVPGYAASKGGIGQLAKALANEWAGEEVNAIAPEYINTDTLKVWGMILSLRVLYWLESRLADTESPVISRAQSFFRPRAPASMSRGGVLVVDGGWMVKIEWETLCDSEKLLASDDY